MVWESDSICEPLFMMKGHEIAVIAVEVRRNEIWMVTGGFDSTMS